MVDMISPWAKQRENLALSRDQGLTLRGFPYESCLGLWHGNWQRFLQNRVILVLIGLLRENREYRLSIFKSTPSGRMCNALYI